VQTNFVLKCSSCGAPAADCVPLCPYCGKATGFGATDVPDGVERMRGGGLRIGNGARIELGVSAEPRHCPFCGGVAAREARFCSFCKHKIVIERMRVARLHITGGGSLHSGAGGQLQVVGRRKRKLHEAAARGDLRAVRKEVEHGDDPDFPDEEGRRPIHYAARGGHLEVAKWIVSIGAQPDIADDAGVRPMHLADSPEMRSFLEMMGAEPREVPPARPKPDEHYRRRAEWEAQEAQETERRLRAAEEDAKARARADADEAQKERAAARRSLAAAAAALVAALGIVVLTGDTPGIRCSGGECVVEESFLWIGYAERRFPVASIRRVLDSEQWWRPGVRIELDDGTQLVAHRHASRGGTGTTADGLRAFLRDEPNGEMEYETTVPVLWFSCLPLIIVGRIFLDWSGTKQTRG
jgi:hypothetical protein